MNAKHVMSCVRCLQSVMDGERHNERDCDSSILGAIDGMKQNIAEPEWRKELIAGKLA